MVEYITLNDWAFWAFLASGFLLASILLGLAVGAFMRATDSRIEDDENFLQVKSIIERGGK